MRHSTAATAPRRGRPQARRPTALDGASSALERAAWPPLAAAVRGAASAHPCWHTHAYWPNARLPLTGAVAIAAQVGWCARAACDGGARPRAAARRAGSRWRARAGAACVDATVQLQRRERDLSPSPGQPPSTPARWPGLLGRTRRARRALVALERARLRRSCADARSGSVVAGAPPLSGRHTQNCRREAAASGFPRDRLRPRRPPDCIGFLLHSFSFEQ